MREPAKYLGAVIAAMALLSGASYYYQTHQEAERAACQSRFNAAFSEALVQRSTLGTIRGDATSALLTGVSRLVLHPATDAKGQTAQGAAFTKLFQDYVAADAAYQQAKADNPYPTLPTDCR